MPPPLFGVHGWDFNVGEATAQFDEISKALGGRVIHPFFWDTKHSLIGSWLRGFAGGYHRAWKDAEMAGVSFSDRLQVQPSKDVDIVCHSLGSRVVFSALAHLDARGPRVRKVLVLNGSDEVAHAEPVVRARRDTAFYNIRSPKEDWVLWELGWKFVPVTPQVKKQIQAGKRGWPPIVGFQGMKDPPPNWVDHVIGGDHWASFREERYWPLLQQLME